MRCLNSPATLNALESTIVESTPIGARHVLVVNAGDGRLPRAIAEKLGADAVMSVITVQPGLRKFVDDFAGAGAAPWDLHWHAERVKRHGAYDYVIFYQLHEYWEGALQTCSSLLGLARTGALVFTSFINAQSARMVSRFLPPVQLGFASMADPSRMAPNLDLASYMDFVAKSGGEITQLWGLLDSSAQEYCQKQLGQRVTWEIRGVKVTVNSVADAYLWGAAVTAVASVVGTRNAQPVTPKVSFSPFSSALFQALVLPYPEEQTQEGASFVAGIESAAWRRAPSDKMGPLLQLLVNQVPDGDKARRVLLVGAGWGRDLIPLKRSQRAWDIIGVEMNPAVLQLSAELRAAEKVEIVAAQSDGVLPFEDGSFDLSLSLGYFSSLYEPAARHLAKELRRVTKGTIYHLEDARGPDHALQLKVVPLGTVYSEMGLKPQVEPVLGDGAATGLYLLKVATKGD